MGRIPEKNVGANNVKVNSSEISYTYMVIKYPHMYMCLSEIADDDCLIPSPTILFQAWEVGEYQMTRGIPVQPTENSPLSQIRRH